MRWQRSSACWRTAGVQCSSAKTTSEAAVSVTPVPHAVTLSTAQRMLSSVWKRRKASCRSCEGVDPSTRMYLMRISFAASSRASSTCRWCANTSSLTPPSSSSAQNCIAASALARPDAVYHSPSACRSSRCAAYACSQLDCAPWLPRSLPMLSITDAQIRSDSFALSAGSSTWMHCRRFGGSCASTCDLSRLYMNSCEGRR
mmetsp:Transcript_23356/g.59883  ORF Transcript_23356/g.59883 Transcript_23356/m.59883 type:complete len:201 (+) Transcript_23356:1898-2500(+)